MNALISMEVVTSFDVCITHSSNANRNVKKSSFNLKFLKELLFT